MPDSVDVKTQLKKRARRRLVGSVALAGFIAAVLPMIMDDEPEPPQSVRLLIPGEDTPFRPNAPARSSNNSGASSAPSAPAPSSAPSASPAPSASSPGAAPPASTSQGEARKPADKPATKPTGKPEEKLTPAQLAEKKRAEDILSGRFSEPDAPARFVILIGAFSNPANVTSLQSKLGSLGVKTFTEPLESPDGKKTRLRAGPFATKSAADQALAKMKRIGVNGVVAARP
ncbi:MAG: SPOR domain-containing protein [Candidatus Accumulibacter sp.]|jgi:DedD protein|nr:SPOR domain-containing protein [Accumulibacter sp.]